MAIDPPPLGDPSHNATRAELCRLFLLHAADLRISEGDAVANVDNIAAIMMGLHARAVRDGNSAWLEKHRWFAEACDRLMHDAPAVRPDG